MNDIFIGLMEQRVEEVLSERGRTFPASPAERELRAYYDGQLDILAELLSRAKEGLEISHPFLYERLEQLAERARQEVFS